LLVHPRFITGNMLVPLFAKVVQPYVVLAYPKLFAPETPRNFEQVAAGTSFTFRVTVVYLHGVRVLRVTPFLLFDCHTLAPKFAMQLGVGREFFKLEPLWN
jgi:hypothetical protein